MAAKNLGVELSKESGKGYNASKQVPKAGVELSKERGKGYNAMVTMSRETIPPKGKKKTAPKRVSGK